MGRNRAPHAGLAVITSKTIRQNNFGGAHPRPPGAGEGTQAMRTGGTESRSCGRAPGASSCRVLLEPRDPLGDSQVDVVLGLPPDGLLDEADVHADAGVATGRLARHPPDGVTAMRARCGMGRDLLCAPARV